MVSVIPSILLVCWRKQCAVSKSTLSWSDWCGCYHVFRGQHVRHKESGCSAKAQQEIREVYSNHRQRTGEMNRLQELNPSSFASGNKIGTEWELCSPVTYISIQRGNFTVGTVLGPDWKTLMPTFQISIQWYQDFRNVGGSCKYLWMYFSDFLLCFKS